MPWFVIRNHPGQALRASRHLLRQGFEPYNPMFLDRRRNQTQQLFVGYMFTRSLQGRWRALLSTEGVCNLLMSAPERPAELPDHQVEAIRACEVGGLVQLSQSKFQPGQKVRSTSGPLRGMEGLYAGQRDRDRVRVLMDILGRRCAVDLQEGNLVAA